jgi:hypothetical protein
MAVTQLSDLTIVPKVFYQSMAQESLNKDVLLTSGVVVRDRQLDEFLSGSIGGKTVEVRRLAALADNDPNISTDDPATKAVPDKLGDVSTTAVRQSLNKAWSQMDLAADLYGSDPLGSISGRLSKYWQSVRQTRILQSLQGVLADSVANHSSDLVIDVTGGDALASAAITEKNFMNSNAIIDAAALMGDRSSDLAVLIVHSAVYATMEKLNLITTEKLSDTNIFISHYMGFRILRDDNTTVELRTPTGGTPPPPYNVYYSYLFGPEAIVVGEGLPKNPVEIQRDALAGNGGGQETIVSRVEWILHPQGYKCGLDVTPTPAQLKTAANWTRAYDRKRLKFSCIKSRG